MTNSIIKLVKDGEIEITHDGKTVNLPLQVVLHAAELIKQTYSIEPRPDYSVNPLDIVWPAARAHTGPR